MHGGDEIGAIVLDLGTSYTKAGYAGEDTPKSVFPTDVGVLFQTGNETTVGERVKAIGEEVDVDQSSKKPSKKITYLVGSNAVSHRRDYMEIKNPMEGGLYKDFDMIEGIWSHTLSDQLRVEGNTTPILLGEPSFNTQAIREKTTEILFEKFSTPALFLSKNSVLSAFASGKSTALVMDSGGGVTCVNTVVDGYALQKSLIKSPLAGDYLTQYYLHWLEQKKVEIRPHYLISSKKEIRPGEFEVELKDLSKVHTTNSFKQFSILQLVRDIKESGGRLSETPFDEAANTNIPNYSYELPDGNMIDLGTERYKISETLFNPSSLNNPNNSDPFLSQFRANSREDFMGYTQMIINSISRSDADIRRDLFNNIILTGGNTLISGFPERLHKELAEKAPQMYKLKILATNTPVERKFSVFIGGSILGSLGTFHQMWMSKAEYEEHGSSIVQKKCP